MQSLNNSKIQIAAVGDHLSQGDFANTKKAFRKRKPITLTPSSTGSKKLPVDDGSHVVMPVLLFDLGAGAQGILPAVETDIMPWTFLKADKIDESKLQQVKEVPDKEAQSKAQETIPVFPGKEYPTEKVLWEGEEEDAPVHAMPENAEPALATPTPEPQKGYVVKAEIAAYWRSLSEYNQRWVNTRMVEMLGVPLELSVMAISGNQVYLSRWALIAESVQKVWEGLTVGQEHPVTVVNLFRTGAHCLLNGFPVLLPITEVAHTFISEIADYLHKGSTYMAKVVNINPKTGVVTVSTKALAPDPWENVHEVHQPGTYAVGVVTKLKEDGSRYHIRLQSGYTASAPAPAFQSVPIGGSVVLRIVSIVPAKRLIDGRIKNVVTG